MTSQEQTGSQVPLRSDGIDLSLLASATQKQLTLAQQVDETSRFWSSGQRLIDSPLREVMEVSFGSARLVNYVSFQVSRFPLVLVAEYLDLDTNAWTPFSYVVPRLADKPRQVLGRDAVRLVVSESVPARVNSAQAKGHPQHYGRGHWVDEAWKVAPVRTSKIRFVAVRNHLGQPPVDPSGKQVPYSIAIRNAQIGYRVNSPADLPINQDQDWAASRDILGSQVVYSTYSQPASQVIDGDLNTYWRSNPQPVPFSVVPLYLDVRDRAGDGAVVDRFWIDPVTTGVPFNLYYSNSQPSGDFDGLNEVIPEAYRTERGTPVPIFDGATQRPLSIEMRPAARAGISVSNLYTHMRYDQAWWVGVDSRSLTDLEDPASRPIVSVGTTRILQQGDRLRMVSQTGEAAEITLDPALHTSGTRYTLVAAYHPATATRAPYFRLSYQVGDHDTVEAEQQVTALANTTSPVSIGMHPDPQSPDAAALGVHGIVVKSETLTDETEGWFHDEGEQFVADADIASQARGTSRNARLRMHPTYLSAGNPFALVGGSGERFEDLEWTPVLRDYTLRQGYLHLVAPTRARFWKFEMTGLLPEIYENFIAIDRDVQVFPPNVANAYQQAAGRQDNNAVPFGVQTTSDSHSNVTYADAVNALRRAAVDAADATQALVIRDPRQAQEIAKTGWVWSYQPWHTGATIPQFVGTQVHRYESLRIRHTTKVAYFAAIREIQPVRVDYSFDDDTPEYVDHLLDDLNLDPVDTVNVAPGEVGYRSTSAIAEITSKALPSYRRVRGVQFATQESNSIQVLEDPNFEAEDLSRWRSYGDAVLERIAVNDVIVRRGWVPYSYLDTERRFVTYGGMDGQGYRDLEGHPHAGGYAEGGFTSKAYSPSGGGSVRAVVKVSATDEINAPVLVEIISVQSGKIVATGQQRLRREETATISLSYAPGQITQRRTWADVETMKGTPTSYGALDGRNLYSIENEFGVSSDLYVRVRQQGATNDSFHVHKVGLYDSPVAWFFSNDDGDNWWQAVDVRNDPHGVLMFPDPPPIFQQDAAPTSLRYDRAFPMAYIGNRNQGSGLTNKHRWIYVDWKAPLSVTQDLTLYGQSSPEPSGNLYRYPAAQPPANLLPPTGWTRSWFANRSASMASNFSYISVSLPDLPIGAEFRINEIGTVNDRVDEISVQVDGSDITPWSAGNGSKPITVGPSIAGPVSLRTFIPFPQRYRANGEVEHDFVYVDYKAGTAGRDLSVEEIGGYYGDRTLTPYPTNPFPQYQPAEGWTRKWFNNTDGVNGSMSAVMIFTVQNVAPGEQFQINEAGTVYSNGSKYNVIYNGSEGADKWTGNNGRDVDCVGGYVTIFAIGKVDGYITTTSEGLMVQAPQQPGVGSTLRWKARIFSEGASISALHIRPWYGTRDKGIPAAHPLDALGPNRSTQDVTPSIEQHPMWQNPFTPVERSFADSVYEPIVRNLVLNPSAEGNDASQFEEVKGGTVEIADTGYLSGHSFAYRTRSPLPYHVSGFRTFNTEQPQQVPVGTALGDLMVVGLISAIDGRMDMEDSRLTPVWVNVLDGHKVGVWVGYADTLTQVLSNITALSPGAGKQSGMILSLRADDASKRLQWDPERTGTSAQQPGNRGYLPGLPGSGSGAVSVVFTSGPANTNGYSWSESLGYTKIAESQTGIPVVTMARSNLFTVQRQPTPVDNLLDVWASVVIGLK